MIDPYETLGRLRIKINPDARYLSGRRVLVTGAGGSIGSELCRRIALYDVADLVMIDRDESALHAVQLSTHGRALLDDRSTVLGDIRDLRWLRQIFMDTRPEIVFHAAALKHQPLLERYPGEAVKTNIWGTLNVLRVSARVGADLIVNVSTDKAADPTCVLGASKRVAERMVAWYKPERFISVRFGNVFGSRGSVVETFTWQLQNHLPVTVTGSDMRRYFITPEEAIDLLIHAGSIGQTGQALVMDMGEPVRISDLALRIAAQLGVSADVVYTGQRPGEKVSETLLGAREVDQRPAHPMIRQIRVPALEHGAADEICVDLADPALTRKQLFGLLL
jgi:FlaA1/EpsC-like NDP-sugar epimerase